MGDRLQPPKPGCGDPRRPVVALRSLVPRFRLAGGGAEVVTEVDAVEATDVAAAFEAVTVNVYAVEAVRPETVMGEVLPVAVTPPGEEVTV